jgi:uncharacterized membrane protein YphA (DoxX/SURF4 family)
MTRPLTPDLCIIGAGSRVCRLPQTLAQMGAAVVSIESGLIMGKLGPFRFVNNIVLPHFYLFAPIVYLLEVLTSVSLILGIFVRLWALIGTLQIVNL